MLPPFLTTWPVLESTLCVLDFNVHPERKDSVVVPQDSGTSYQFVTDPSRVAAGTVFEDDIVTSLPYSASTRSGKFHYSGFMIDDERIIGMKVCHLLASISRGLMAVVFHSQWHLQRVT